MCKSSYVFWPSDQDCTSRENEAYSALLVLMEQIACLHVDVLSLPSQGRQTMKLLRARTKKRNGKKIYGGENPFHSFISHCTATAPGTSMGTKPSGAHCIRSTQFHIISEIISFFTLTFLFAHSCLKCQIFWESHKNLKKILLCFTLHIRSFKYYLKELSYILCNFVSSQYLNCKGIFTQ